MVTGEEEEMKLHQTTTRRNKINQLKPSNNRYYQITQSHPFHFCIPTLKSPQIYPPLHSVYSLDAPHLIPISFFSIPTRFTYPFFFYWEAEKEKKYFSQ